MDDDAQFAEDNVSEPDPSSPTRSHTASSKRQGKGKQQSTLSGPVPLEGIQAAQALGVRTMEQADILANALICLKGAAAIVSDRLKTTGSER